MSVIYEPSGKAREYSPLALNLYRGCGHGCIYCYAPACLKMQKSEFFQAPAPRPGVLDKLAREAARMRGDRREILLCFTTDPYQPLDEVERLTRRALEIMEDNRLVPQVLTKGGARAARDLDILARIPGAQVGVTLTFMGERQSREWEPGAAPPSERLALLREAHARGIKTWVSFEPVIEPEQVYRLVEESAPYVDLYKVGKLNYHKRAREIDWVAFRGRVEQALERLGKAFYIKEDLQKAR